MEIRMEFLAIRVTANTLLSTYYMPGTMLSALYMDIRNSKQIIVIKCWSVSQALYMITHEILTTF